MSPTLKRIARKLNKGYCSFLSEEDLFQEALLHLWQSFQEGALEDKTDSYILQGCYFYLKNYLRKMRVYTKFVSIDERTETFEEEEGCFTKRPVLGDEHTEQIRDQVHTKILIERILKFGNNGIEKRMLALYAQGMTIREIGSALGVSHVWVVKLMNRIRNKARDYVNEIA